MAYNFSNLDTAVQTAKAAMETAAESKDVDDFSTAAGTYHEKLDDLYTALFNACSVVGTQRKQASDYLDTVTKYNALIDAFDGDDET